MLPPSSSWRRPRRATTSARFGMEPKPQPAPGGRAHLCGAPAVQARPRDPADLRPMPQPKWVISMGACASTGGIFDNYAMWQGIDTIGPRGRVLPGCPPRPRGLLYGILLHAQESRENRWFDHAQRRDDNPGRAWPATAAERSTRSPAVRTPSTSSARGDPPQKPCADLRRRDRPRGRVVRRHDRVRGPRGAAHGMAWLRDTPGSQYDFCHVTALEYRDRERSLEVVYNVRSLERRTDLR